MKNEKQLENLTACILSGNIFLHYLEQLKHTQFYKHSTKNKANQAIAELLRIEKTFDLVDATNEELTHQVSSNLMTGLEFVMQKGFSNQMVLMNMQLAYDKEPKATEGIINKILNR